MGLLCALEAGGNIQNISGDSSSSYKALFGSGSTLCKYRTWLRVENLTFQHLKVIFLLKIGSLENRNRIKELDTEQLLVPCCEVQAIHLNTWGYRLLY